MTKRDTLSEPRSRTELIAAFEAARSTGVFATPDNPVPAAPEAVDKSAGTKDPDAAPPATDPDAEVTDGAKALLDSIEKLKAEQTADPDNATDPNDADVSKLINQLDTIATQLVQAQAKDVTAENPPAVGDSPDPTMNPTDKTPATNKTSTTSEPFADSDAVDPTDAVGNVDPDVVCATPGCGHKASLHADDGTGNNTGACSTPGCDCQQMTFMSNANNPGVQGDEADDDAAAGGADQPAGPVSASTKGAYFGFLEDLFDPEMAPIMLPPEGLLQPPAQPVDLPEIQPANSALNARPVIPGSDVMGKPFLIPVGIIEGQATDDGRSVAVDSTEWLSMPLPLMGQDTSTHDPTGMDQNDPAVLCGRIDSVVRTAGENGTQIISAKGFFLPDADGQKFEAKVEAMGSIGVSADLKVFDQITMPGAMDDMGFPDEMVPMIDVVTKGELAGFTIVVPSPAFPQCYIQIDDGTTDKAPIPVQTPDQEPVAASYGIHFMQMVRDGEDRAKCLPCGDSDVVVEAESIVAGASPVDVPMRPPKAWFDNPGFYLGDDRMVEIFTGRGEKRLGGQFACPLTITDEGQVFGHIAPWGVCHTGYKGKCVTAPHSNMNYSQFMRAGQQLITAEGERVRVGPLTFATGHADLNGNLSARDVISHYDNTGTVWADVVAGEDEFGIWVAGAIRPNLNQLQLRQVMAASPSGDWREVEDGLELMAVLQVNQPGFPIALVSDGQVRAVVAAGAMTMRLAREAEEFLADVRSEQMSFADREIRRIVYASSSKRLDAFAQMLYDESIEKLDRQLASLAL